MPPDEIKPGDWVVWSDYHNEQSDGFRKELGPGPFKVQEVKPNGLHLHETRFHLHGGFGVLWTGRFVKSTFITAVKEALKDA